MAYRVQSQLLRKICDIRSGYTARGRLDPAAHSGIPAIQLRDLHQQESDLEFSSLGLYALPGSVERYLAGSGDLLFRSRGERNTAIAIAPGTKKTAVAILPLLILRPDRSLIEPHYLAWFINQPRTQRYFDKCARGTRLRMIPKACLDDLEVSVPSLETQRRIVEIDRLAQREHALMLQLAEKKLELTGSALLQQVQDAQPHGNGLGVGAGCKPAPTWSSEG